MGEWFVCIVVMQVCVDFSEVVSCVHYANTPPLSHCLMKRDWVFLRLFNAVFSCNVRLL